jgi:hypothetical protein
VLSVVSAKTSEEQETQYDEFDATLCLEWAVRMACVGNCASSDLVAPIFECIAEILGTKKNEIYKIFPYLVERCIYHLLCAARLYSNDILWKSLCIIRDFPPEFSSVLAERIGIGTLSIIRFNSNISAPEHWFAIFGLVNASMVSEFGRPFAWSSICHLIDNSHITDLNFSHCRQAIMRFLHGVFPGDEFVSSKKPTDAQSLLRPLNHWLLGSFYALTRVALIAIGSHSESLEDDVVSDHEMNFPLPPVLVMFKENEQATNTSMQLLKNCKCYIPSKQDRIKFLRYLIFDTTSSHSVSPAAKSVSASASPSGSGFGGESQEMPLINVSSIHFEDATQIDHLWIETCKTLSDFVNEMPNISISASDCLQTLLIGGAIVGISEKTWCGMLMELLRRLPLNFMGALHRFTDLTKDGLIICEVVLRSTSLLSDVLVSKFRLLHNTNEFREIWKKCLNSIISNINSVPSTSPLIPESLELINSLLRVLRQHLSSCASDTNADDVSLDDPMFVLLVESNNSIMNSPISHLVSSSMLNSVKDLIVKIQNKSAEAAKAETEARLRARSGEVAETSLAKTTENRSGVAEIQTMSPSTEASEISTIVTVSGEGAATTTTITSGTDAGASASDVTTKENSVYAEQPESGKGKEDGSEEPTEEPPSSGFMSFFW